MQRATSKCDGLSISSGEHFGNSCNNTNQNNPCCKDKTCTLVSKIVFDKSVIRKKINKKRFSVGTNALQGKF